MTDLPGSYGQIPGFRSGTTRLNRVWSHGRCYDGVPISVVAVGDQASKKTAVLATYSEDDYPTGYIPISGFEGVKRHEVDGVWYDIRFETREARVELCDVILLCYSVWHEASLRFLSERWLPRIRHQNPDATLFLVGTRAHRGRGKRMAEADVARVVQDSGIAHRATCSAKRRPESVIAIFDRCIRKYIEDHSLLPPIAPMPISELFGRDDLFFNGSRILVVGGFADVLRLNSSTLEDSTGGALPTLGHSNTRIIQMSGLSDSDVPVVAVTTTGMTMDIAAWRKRNSEQKKKTFVELYSLLDKKRLLVIPLTEYSSRDHHHTEHGLCTYAFPDRQLCFDPLLVAGAGDVINSSSGKLLYRLVDTPTCPWRIRCYPSMCPMSVFVAGTCYGRRGAEGHFYQYDLSRSSGEILRKYESKSFNFFDIEAHQKRSFIMSVSEDASLTIWGKNDPAIRHRVQLGYKGGSVTCFEEKDLIVATECSLGLSVWDCRKLENAVRTIPIKGLGFGWSMERIDEKHVVLGDQSTRKVYVVNVIDDGLARPIKAMRRIPGRGVDDVCILRRPVEARDSYAGREEESRIRFFVETEAISSLLGAKCRFVGGLRVVFPRAFLEEI